MTQKLQFSRLWKRYGKFEYLLLFLASIELMGVHHYLLFFLIIYLILKRRISTTFYKADIILLVLWGIFYWIYISKSHLWSSLQVPSWLVAFIIGASLCKDKQSFFDVLLIMALGYAVEGLLTVTLSEGMDSMIGFGGDISGVDRRVDSIWGNGITRSFSACNVSYYLFSGVLICLLYSRENTLLQKGFALFFGLSFILVSVRIAMRSSLLFNPIIFALSFLALSSKRGRRSGSFSLFLIILAVFVVIYFTGVYERLMDSYLFYRIDTQEDGGFTHNTRFSLHSSFWSVWDQHIWGDLHDQVGYFFHNTWMDVYAFSGIISAFFFLVLSIRWLINAFYIFKRTDGLERSIMTGITAAFYLPFYMDPMLQAAPAFMAFYIITYGMLSKRRIIIACEYATT